MAVLSIEVFGLSHLTRPELYFVNLVHQQFRSSPVIQLCATTLEDGSIYHSQKAQTKRPTASYSFSRPGCSWKIHHRCASALPKCRRRPGAQGHQSNPRLQNLYHRV